MSRESSRAVTLLFLLVIALITPVGYAVDWSLDMRLTWNSASDGMPSMTRANDGRIWLFWQSRRTGNYDIFYKIYNSSSVHQWSPETRLTDDSNWDYLPYAMQAANGRIWVVWASNRTGGGFFYDIFYKVYDGSTWSADTRLTFDASNDEFPSIAQTNDGKIWVFWNSRRTGNNDIFYKTTVDNGVSWSADTRFALSHATDDDWDPAVIRSADGKLWLFWVISPSQAIYYSVFDGSSWTSRLSLTGSTVENWHPAATQTNDGIIWLVWDKGSDTAPTDIYYKTFNGSTWSSETQLTTHGDNDSGPSIAQDSQGKILIAWASDRGDGIIQPYDLFYRVYSVSPVHDVELFSVVPNATAIIRGQNVAVEVVARNRGTSSETNAVVKCYVNSTLLGSRTLNMAPGELYPFYFTWFTSGFASANYTLKANITSVSGEVNIIDNTYVDGVVEIMKGPVAIYSVSPVFPQPNEMITFNATLSKPNGGAIVSYRWNFGDGNVTIMSTPIVYHKYSLSGPYWVNLTVTDSQGLADSTLKTVVVAVHDVAVVGGFIADKVPWSQSIFCYVNVANQGDVEETVAVLVYFNDTFVGFEYVDVPYGTVVLNVPVWCNTSLVAPNSYQVRAEALAVVGERDLSDNSRILDSLWVYKIVGDVNNDGVVNSVDLGEFAGSFGSTLGSSNWDVDCDINEDNIVNVYDLRLIGRNYGNTSP